MEELKTSHQPAGLDLKQVILIHRHGARTPTHGDLIGHISSSLWKQCNLSPFLHAIQAAADHPRYTDNAVGTDKPHLLVAHPMHKKPPTVARISFGAPSGSRASEQHLAASRSVRQIKSMLQKAGVGSCFSGQLTDIGKLSLYDLGQNMRGLYIDQLKLMPSVLDSRSARFLYLRSTDYTRTIESLQYLLHGFYPPLKRQAPNSLNLHIHVRPDTTETMYPRDDCAALAVEIKRFRDTFKAHSAKRIETTLAKFPILANAFGAGISDMNKVFRIYDTLQCLEGNHLPLPQNVTQSHVEELTALVVDQWGKIFESSDFIASMSLGRFISEFSLQLQAAARGQHDTPKFAIYSGHDTTILPILSAFKASDGAHPGYGSNLLFELHKAQPKSSLWRRMTGWTPPSQHYVRMLYNGSAHALPGCAAPGQHFPGHSEICTLDAFMKEVERITPKNYETKCMSPLKVIPDWD
ncbi:hypothetical protein BSLG_007741 [Batrachochytrium salamandrivorans]|nr:hypothetical protein BASA60_004703 [Batrachochytrium salamandrivorans]KAJ1334586.1 hypothetical protein BSLG_007741 [Batrachochytrium salamandrivorans]